jgi:hypothetical protein
MAEDEKPLVLTESERPAGFPYPPQYLFVVQELGIHRLDPWWFPLGKLLRLKYSAVRDRFPDRELVPFACWEALVACWDRERPGRVILMDIIDTSHRGTDVGDFWEWFTGAVQQMIADHYDGD